MLIQSVFFQEPFFLIFYSYKTPKTNDLCKFIDLESIKNNHYTSETCIKHPLCAYLREILC